MELQYNYEKWPYKIFGVEYYPNYDNLDKKEKDANKAKKAFDT